MVLDQINDRLRVVSVLPDNIKQLLQYILSSNVVICTHIINEGNILLTVNV